MSNSSKARQRIFSLLDENSFVEIGAHVMARATTFNMKQSETPGDGVVTGYGVIDGHLVYVYSQDVSVMNGSVGEMHAKKIINLYNLALKTGAPIIGFIDSAGIRLQEATDALNAFGEIYLKQTLASGVIPQITAIFGSCGGGLAMMSALTDFTFMEEKNAKLFVNTPNSLSGNSIDKCNNTTAKFQSSETGMVSGVGSEEEIVKKIRTLVSFLPENNEDDMSYEECLDDLNRLVPEIAGLKEDTLLALEALADENFFLEIKGNYAKEMVTGFMKLNGITIGCIANRSMVHDADGRIVQKFDSVLTTAGCQKASDFITFCDAYNVPLLSLTNVTGYEANIESEKTIAKAVAKLTYSFANATTPKVNVVIGKAFGNAYIAMNSKAIGADVTIAWDSAQIGMMDAELAAKIMYEGESAEVIKDKTEEYDKLQNNIFSAAGRGYVDEIIEADQTRKYIIGAFEMLFTKREDRPTKKHGTV